MLKISIPLFFAFIVNIIKFSNAGVSLIWSRKEEDFIPLFSIPIFSKHRNDYVKWTREQEIPKNLHKLPLTIVYTEEKNFLTFFNNDTQVTGVCGEIWNVMSDYFNFTLVPMKLSHEHIINKSGGNEVPGLLGFVMRNEAQIVPRYAMLSEYIDSIDYSLPLWSIRYHIFLQPEWKYDSLWMFRLFSIELVCSYFILLLVLSITGYLCKKYSMTVTKEENPYKLRDHIFYTIGIGFSQGYVPPGLQKKSRTIFLSTCLVAFVVSIAFSSNAIFLMMNRKYSLPFDDLKSLFRKSDYSILVYSGSMVYELFMGEISKYRKYEEDRIISVSSVQELYTTVCYSNMNKISLFEAYDRHQAVSGDYCHLVKTGPPYFSSWIASAYKKGFKYKKTFSLGILKLLETGIIDGLRDRWLDTKNIKHEEFPFRSVDISQVYMIFSVLIFGFILSIFILFVEHLISVRNLLKIHYKNSKAKVIVQKIVLNE